MTLKAVSFAQAWGFICIRHLVIVLVSVWFVVLSASCARPNKQQVKTAIAADATQAGTTTSASIPTKVTPKPSQSESSSPPKVLKNAEPVVWTIAPPAPAPPERPPPAVETPSTTPASAVGEEKTQKNISYNSPSVMQEDVQEHIYLAISKKGTLGQLKDYLAKDVKDHGGIISGSLKGDRMSLTDSVTAILTPERKGDFEITALAENQQRIDDSGRTTWVWAVTPTVNGRSDRMLSLTIYDSTRNGPGDNEVCHYKIKVVVNRRLEAIKWFDDNWKWSFSSIIIPLAAWIWKERKDILRKPNRSRRRVKATTRRKSD